MRSQPKWLRALSELQDAVYVANDAQRIVYWNAAAHELLGYSEAEVLNQPCYQIMRGKVCGKPWCRAACAIQRSVKRGALLQAFDMRTCKRDGQEVSLKVSIFSVVKKDKWFSIHVLTDLTREEQTKVALGKVLDTLKSVSAGNEIGEDGKGRNPQDHLFTLQAPAEVQLTRREIEVLTLLAEGLSTRDLSRRMGISPFTVRRHIESILLKTGLHTQAQAVAYAYRAGLL